MHICIISNLFPPHMRGGAERVAFRVGKGLRDRGHQVSVISTKPEGSEIDKTVEDGMKIFRFKPRNVYYQLDDYKQSIIKKYLWHVLDMYDRSSAKTVEELLEEIKPDLVVTHNLKGIGLSIPKAVQKNYPHIHVLHDVQLVIPSGLLIKGEEENKTNIGFVQKWYQKATAKLMGKPSLVISPSQFLLDFHTEHGLFNEIQTQVLPNPTPEFGIAERTKQNGPLKILYLGSLESHKGIEFLLDALKDPDVYCELMIAGKGSLTDLVKKTADEYSKIDFFGPFNPSEAAELLGQSDVTVVPSLCYENSPTVIFESLSCGVPVIASKIGGIPELIKQGENGYLFEPGDTQSFLHTLEQLYYKRDQWFERGDEIRMSMSEHSMTYYLDRFEEIIKKTK
ncbi:MAG: glycosyltransferase family 4 protein [Candidatus Uhrbacteria bacterium]|nr:glycosyltransferase family 4 protein [Patescibacteria group bacterium]MBU1907352.1 glycosyltransferase family 4 protein [Patescibacteria group bacterium]